MRTWQQVRRDHRDSVVSLSGLVHSFSWLVHDEALMTNESVAKSERREQRLAPRGRIRVLPNSDANLVAVRGYLERTGASACPVPIQHFFQQQF